MAIDPERHARILAMMREEKLDALICSSPTEVLLLTGYWPVMGTSVAVFTIDGEVHVLVPTDEHEIAVKSLSAALTAFNPGELYSITTPQAAIAQPLTSLCALLSLAHARIGMEREQGVQPASYAVTAFYRSALVDILRGAFPQVEIVAVDTLLERLKASKTTIELEKIDSRQSHERTDLAAFFALYRTRESTGDLQESHPQGRRLNLLQRLDGIVGKLAAGVTDNPFASF